MSRPRDCGQAPASKLSYSEVCRYPARYVEQVHVIQMAAVAEHETGLISQWTETAPAERKSVTVSGADSKPNNAATHDNHA